MAVDSIFVQDRKVTIIQNHNIVMRLLYFRFKIFEFYVMFTFIIFANLIQ